MSPQPFLLLHRTKLKTELTAVCTFLFIIVLIRFDVFLNLSSKYLGGYSGDGGLYVWLTLSNIRGLLSAPWFNTSAFYPYGQTLAWSDNFILPSLWAGLLTILGVGSIAAYNLTLLTASFLNGYLTYRLTYKITGDLVAALVGGTAFMTLSHLTGNLGHPQLQFAFFLPLGLSAILSFVSRPRITTAIALGMAVFAAFLTTVYYALFLVVLYGIALGAVALLRPHHLSRPDYSRFIAGCSIGFLPIVPFLLPYFQVREAFGSRALYESYYFAATGLSYLASPPLNLLYGFTTGLSHDEGHLFPGFVIIVLSAFPLLRLWEAKPLRRHLVIVATTLLGAAVSSCWVMSGIGVQYLCSALLWISCVTLVLFLYRFGKLEQKLGFSIMTNRALSGVLLAIALFFFAISFGPLGNPARGEFATGIFSFFYLSVPGFNSLRAVSRAGIVVLFSLSALAALGAHRIFERNPKLKFASPALFFALLLETHHQAIPLDPPLPPPSAMMQGWLPSENGRPSNDALIMLPLAGEVDRKEGVKSWGDFARKNTFAMLGAFSVNLPTVNGYSGQRSRIMKEFPKSLASFPDERSLNELATICGLKYVVYRSTEVVGFNEQNFTTAVAQFPSRLKLVTAAQDGSYLFELSNERVIENDFSLLCPPYSEGKTLNFEILSPATSVPQEKPTIEIFLDGFSETVPFAVLPAPSTGIWEKSGIRLIAPSDQVRPLRIRLRTQSKLPISIRNHAISP